ncbi:Uncharacterised protein [Mycoplasmopsis maculosa]|uniref:Uncharacterized protein n=1 Tax=Mycoplasmopsis maculosa TaxID=114885 RepID=A0A449B499_9BACT|nr:hypothetical protein [Mycoplasmopsis maculosa]VEU75422.1 Uncharacterised protein [Mycoplasmopsis maculosa]
MTRAERREYSIHIPKLPKLIDRGDNSESNQSAWHNWEDFNYANAQTYFIFKWTKPKQVSRMDITLLDFKSNQTGNPVKMPTNITIQTSEDGKNWVNVNNQDKANQEDFPPFKPHHKWQGTFAAQTINFDKTTTQWIKVKWTPARNSQNQSLSIYVTDVKFFGSNTVELKNNVKTDISLNSISLNNEKATLNENGQFVMNNVFDIKNLTFEYIGKYLDIALLTENENQKNYKIAIYNELSNYKIYDLIINKGQ